MSILQAPRDCPWPAVTRACAGCGIEASPWEARYIAVGQPGGWYWSWRHEGCESGAGVPVQVGRAWSELR